MVIYNYLGKKYLKLLSITTLVIILLVLLIDSIELLRRFAKKNIEIKKIIEVSLLKQTPLLIEILPFIILISSIFFFTRLSSNSEITIMRSSSLNSKSIFIYPLLVIFIISLMDISFLRVMANKSKEKYEYIMKNDFGVAKKVNHNHLWFKENSDKPYIFGAKKIKIADKIYFNDLIIINLDKNNQVITKANKAVLENKLIKMSEVKIIDGEQNIKNIKTLNLPMTIDSDLVKNRFSHRNIDIKNHYAIHNLIIKIISDHKYGENVKSYKILLHNMLARTLFYIFLFLLAAYFCIFPPRYKKKLINIIITISISFIAFFILNILFTLTYSGKINLYYGIWLPNIILLLTVINLNIKAELGKKIWS
ncbi:MAG: LptF/LptG family permease [Rickettsiales bacterium]|nr:LptF/LptG family permease [Rickettsiales bacterium]